MHPENKKTGPGSYFLSTQFLTRDLLFVGFGLFAFSLLMNGGGFENATLISASLSLLSCLLFIANGIFVILRKVAPRPGSDNIQGVSAIVAGAVLIVVAVSLGFFFVQDLFSILSTR